jgi:hypothetical protein
MSSNRKCSLCHGVSHTITTCQDIKIDELNIACKITSVYLTEEEFSSWLHQFKTIVLKALCFQYELADTMRDIKNKSIAIMKLTDNFYWERKFQEMTRLVNLKHRLSAIPSTQITVLVSEENNEETSCPCCYETNNIVTYNCNHTICLSCLQGTIKTLSSPQLLTCSLCRSQITHISSNSIDEIHSSICETVTF